MCGRYSLTTDQEALSIALGVERIMHPRPRYNIAPTQTAPVLRSDPEGPMPRVQRWGLVPSWSDSLSSGPPLINARSETAHRKPSFREAFRRSRCLVPADGFFEWRGAAGNKLPFWIHFEARRPFTFAGLSERWTSSEGEGVESFTILTTEADDGLRSIHSRMPVIIDAGSRSDWLDPEASIESLRGLLAEARSDGLVVTPVSTRVNSPAHDDPECVEPIDDPGTAAGPRQTSLF